MSPKHLITAFQKSDEKKKVLGLKAVMGARLNPAM